MKLSQVPYNITPGGSPPEPPICPLCKEYPCECEDLEQEGSADEQATN